MNQKEYVIVVGLDFSPLADRAFAKAYELASARERAVLHVVHVVPAINGEVAYPLSGGLVTPAHTETIEELATKLHQHVKALVSNQQRSSTGRLRIASHVRFDAAAIGIASLASELEADMIVLGTQGHHGFSRWLLGSVAEGVIRHAHSPVLVIPPESTGLAVPEIEPPCPLCVQTRKETGGDSLWCAQHRERHGRRHTYHQSDRVAAQTNLPLVSR